MTAKTAAEELLLPEEIASVPPEWADRPIYYLAWQALQAAHDACNTAPGRDVLGLSHGPFSGVNRALGYLSFLEERVKAWEGTRGR